MVVLICISLIVSEVEHLFIHLFTNSMSSWRGVCLEPVPIFQLDRLVLSFKSSLYILDIKPLLELLFVNISHLVGCLSVLLSVSFDVQKPFSLI